MMTTQPRDASGLPSGISSRRRRVCSQAAFTLLELLAVITIVVVMASIAWIGAKGARKQAERIACGENLKSLYIALQAYTINVGHWPQVTPEKDEKAFWKTWRAKLDKPEYNLPDKVWLCPSHLRSTGDELAPYSSYLPNNFDRTSPNVPHKWANMPWLIEIGDNHGNGPLAIYPDGSIDTTINLESPNTSLQRR